MIKSSEKLSVAFLYDDTLDSNDGVAQYVKTLGAWLSLHGHHVTYLVGQSQTQQWAGGKVISLSKNINVRFNGNRLSMPLYSGSKKIKQALAEQKFDIVHVQVPYSPLMAARVLKRLPASTAIVGTFHILPAGFLSSFGSRLLRIWLNSTLKRFSKFFSVSKPAQQFAASAYKLKSGISPNVINLDQFETDQINQADTIVFLGRLVPRKGCLELIKAFALLKKQLPQTKLIIGGKGPQKKELQKYVAKHQIPDVSFTGFVPEEDKPIFLAQASVACFPSLHGESFGIILTEAMAAGAGLVIGGNNPGYASVLGERPDLLVNPKDTQAFADRLKDLMINKKKAAELHNWLDSEVKQYDVKVVGEQLVRAYSEAIALNVQSGHN